jgi:hypothetical protein
MAMTCGRSAMVVQPAWCRDAVWVAARVFHKTAHTTAQAGFKLRGSSGPGAPVQ